MSNLPIIKCKPKYNMGIKEQNVVFNEIKSILKNKLNYEVMTISEIGAGQNQNYLVKAKNNGEQCKLLLKIISRKGYPDIETLNKCYELLDSIKYRDYKILYSDTSDSITPYGFLIQKWVDGVSVTKQYDIQADDFFDTNKYSENKMYLWLKDYIKIFKETHSIKLDYFGYLANGPRFKTLKEYYNNIDIVVSKSFGEIFDQDISLWKLPERGVVSASFLDEIFGRINELADKLDDKKQSVLIFGDMLPSNIIYNNNSPKLIDWDETRANWWVYEIARAMYYIKSKSLAYYFIENYDPKEDSIEEIDIGIRLEHARQDLRKIYMVSFNQIRSRELIKKVDTIRRDIISILEKNILS